MNAFTIAASIMGASFLFSLFLITTASERVRRNSALFFVTYALTTVTAFVSFWITALLGLVAIAEHLIDYAR